MKWRHDISYPMIHPLKLSWVHEICLPLIQSLLQTGQYARHILFISQPPVVRNLCIQWCCYKGQGVPTSKSICKIYPHTILHILQWRPVSEACSMLASKLAGMEGLSSTTCQAIFWSIEDTALHGPYYTGNDPGVYSS